MLPSLSSVSNLNITSEPHPLQKAIMSTQKSLQSTPPESFTTSPPTPLATDEKTPTAITRILAEVRRQRDGYGQPVAEPWLRFPLEVHHYKELQRWLQKDDLWDYYENKLRYVKNAHIPRFG